MTQKLDTLLESPSQTAGPYVHIGCTPNAIGMSGVYPRDLGASSLSGPAKGQRMSLKGTIFDGFGAPLRDAMIEIWHADAQGRYPGQDGADPYVSGFARAAVDLTSGEFLFETIKPGVVPGRNGQIQAPHISVWLVARGINLGLHTRLYFSDEAEANEQDTILSRIDPKERRQTLLAQHESDQCYRFDIHLQGPQETIFLDI